MSRSRAYGKRNLRSVYDLDPSPMYMVEIEPSIEKARSLLREAQEAYKKEEKKYQRLCQKRAKRKKIKMRKSLNQINVKIKIEKEILDKKRIELEKAKEHLKNRSYAYPFISKR